MVRLIREIKALCRELYGAEISTRDIDVFYTLGQDVCQQIVDILKGKEVPDDVITTLPLQD